MNNKLIVVNKLLIINSSRSIKFRLYFRKINKAYKQLELRKLIINIYHP